ncbi:MAG: M23 family metallopeptidase [Myxococcota bacterium]|nr:M23 family metallopeptidase [Myxococcota bacterium]
MGFRRQSFIVCLTSTIFVSNVGAEDKESAPEKFVPAFSKKTSVVFHPQQPRRGDLFAVYASAENPQVARIPARIFDYEFELIRVSPKVLRGIAAVPLDAPAGNYDLTLYFPTRDVHRQLEVLHRDWPVSVLNVSSRFTQEPDAKTKKTLRLDDKAWSSMFHPLASVPKYNGAFVRPVTGRKTAVFGTKRTFNDKLQTRHEGLDLEGRTGTPIVAMAAGRVVMSSMRYVFGGTTTIDHGNGLFTSYFHMSKRRKKVGDWVRAGERIGRVGSSGRVTGPHLHLAIMVRVEQLADDGSRKSVGLFVDPEPLLNYSLWGEPGYLEQTVR